MVFRAWTHIYIYYMYIISTFLSSYHKHIHICMGVSIHWTALLDWNTGLSYFSFVEQVYFFTWIVSVLSVDNVIAVTVLLAYYPCTKKAATLCLL